MNYCAYATLSTTYISTSIAERTKANSPARLCKGVEDHFVYLSTDADRRSRPWWIFLECHFSSCHELALRLLIGIALERLGLLHAVLYRTWLSQGSRKCCSDLTSYCSGVAWISMIETVIRRWSNDVNKNMIWRHQVVPRYFSPWQQHVVVGLFKRNLFRL